MPVDDPDCRAVHPVLAAGRRAQHFEAVPLPTVRRKVISTNDASRIAAALPVRRGRHYDGHIALVMERVFMRLTEPDKVGSEIDGKDPLPYRRNSPSIEHQRPLDLHIVVVRS